MGSRDLVAGSASAPVGILLAAPELQDGIRVARDIFEGLHARFRVRHYSTTLSPFDTRNSILRLVEREGSDSILRAWTFSTSSASRFTVTRTRFSGTVVASDHG